MALCFVFFCYLGTMEMTWYYHGGKAQGGIPEHVLHALKHWSSEHC